MKNLMDNLTCVPLDSLRVLALSPDDGFDSGSTSMGNMRPSSFLAVRSSSRTMPALKSTWRHWSASAPLPYTLTVTVN